MPSQEAEVLKHTNWNTEINLIGNFEKLNSEKSRNLK